MVPDDITDDDQLGGCDELIEQLQENVMVPLQLKACNVRFTSSLFSPPKGIQSRQINFIFKNPKAFFFMGRPGVAKR